VPQSLKVSTKTASTLSPLWLVEQYFVKVVLVPQRGKGVYAVSFGAGQSIVALGVATADACVMAEEDWVMEDANFGVGIVQSRH
jgi:hypothetical protein